MGEQEQKHRSMYDCLTAKVSQKEFPKLLDSLWPPSSPNRNLHDYAIWDVFENKTKQKKTKKKTR